MSHILSKRYLRLNILSKNTPIFSALKCSFSSNIDFYKTSNLDPRKHTAEDIGLHYTIDNSITLDALFKEKSLSIGYAEECKTFGETRFLIRKPAVEIINYLNNTDFNNPVNKYILYGKYGSGKTMTILHLVHYAYQSDWIVVHVPKVSHWMFTKTEVAESTSMLGFFDLPTMASSWLTHFKNQNLDVIKKLDLKLQNDYKWNIQEENKAGDSLLSLVDHGIARGKYSSDVINAVLDEVKLLSKCGKVKTLVAIDEYNYFYQPAPKSSHHKYKFRSLNNISFVTGFQNIVKSDWHNGAIVLSLGGKLGSRSTVDYLPLSQLTLEGFEYLSPFIPIEVPPLTRKEMISMLQYYKSKKWILNSVGDEELLMLSAGNALNFRLICGPL